MTPTEREPSAFDAEAKKLDDRLRELISDYSMLLLRYPHVDGQGASTEALEKAQVLAALRVHPWRKTLAGKANELQRDAFGVGQHWFLQMWIDAIPGSIQRHEWDVQAVARDLITTLPAYLRLRCPGYPGSDDRDAFGAATVAVASKIGNEVTVSKRCQDPDAETIGRLALEAMGYTRARDLRLLGPQTRRPKD